MVGARARNARGVVFRQGVAKDLRPFADLEGECRAGVVSRIVPFGVFVTVTLDSGAFADGLVHKSKIKDCGLGILGPVLQNGNGTSTVDVSMQYSAICAYPVTFCESVSAWFDVHEQELFHLFSNTNCASKEVTLPIFPYISHSFGFRQFE